MKTTPTLRVARPTDNLDALLPFYREGLGFEVLYHFEDHDGFDGIMLGLRGAPYHLEFTRHHQHKAGRAPTLDNLLVFYLPDSAEWRAAVGRMEAAGFSPVPAFNPYWDNNGRTFEDLTAIALCYKTHHGADSQRMGRDPLLVSRKS